MAKKFNNKTLVIVLVVLVGLFLVTRAFRQKRSTGTLKTELVQMDTSRISTILLYPGAEQGEEITFTKTVNGWMVQKGDLVVPADNYGIANMLTELQNLAPERLVANGSDKWGDFGVTDSLGTRVIMKEGKKAVTDIVIGRFDYQPSPSPYGGYGRNQGTGLTYVRLTDEPEVYVIQGFLAMSFNQAFNAWRNQLVVQLAKNNINQLTFDYPADTGFIASNPDTVWLINGMPANSASMENYLNGLTRKSNSSFVDGFDPVTGPDYQLTIEGNLATPVIIKAYRMSPGEFIIHSSMNPESYFSSTGEGLFSQIFKSRSGLLAGDL
ncbi:MAG: DUF4340 domain-containing protein [Bacteroidales bacterium]|nr:DUF4340 domain-containing protein [Bacteroidales bacterium]